MSVGELRTELGHNINLSHRMQCAGVNNIYTKPKASAIAHITRVYDLMDKPRIPLA